MKSAPFGDPSADVEGVPRYVSFVLRCQLGAGGQVRSRLFDVRSGRGWIVNNLDELPALVQRLIREVAGAGELPAV